MFVILGFIILCDENKVLKETRKFKNKFFMFNLICQILFPNFILEIDKLTVFSVISVNVNSFPIKEGQYFHIKFNIRWRASQMAPKYPNVLPE